ncbi:MAG: hypothetical protein V2J02_12040 [Pseudomonadales bacterium]|jgi:hypothetical protein|nr:hypothetical protein [Pseudomonadales bacterium]
MGRVKESLERLPGNRLHAVVFCRNAHSARRDQLFLVFENGTSFEFWTDKGALSMASDLDREDASSLVSRLRQVEGAEVHLAESAESEVHSIESGLDAALRDPLKHLDGQDVSSEELLYLAANRTDALLVRLAAQMPHEALQRWVDALSAAFASLLQRCAFDEMYSLYQGPRDSWLSIVQPSGVLPAQLEMFLGGLSIVNERAFQLLERRAAVHAFLVHFGSNTSRHYLDAGQAEGRELLERMNQSG